MSAAIQNLEDENWAPKFVVIGAVKAATTWIQKQLEKNPAIYMPPPEPHYFSSEFSRGKGWYRDFFDVAPPSVTLPGEKSADYLAHPEAASRLAASLPSARLVVQLRDPVERAYSDYKMLFRRGTVKGPPEDYLQTLENPQPRFLRDGLYGEHLTRWLDLFPEEQMLVFLFEDVKNDPRGTVDRVSRHIGTMTVYEPQSAAQRANDSSELFLPLPLRKMLTPLKNSVKPLRGSRIFETARRLLAREIKYPPLSPELRLSMQEFYARDIERLEKKIGRDLSAWRSPDRQISTPETLPTQMRHAT